MEDFKIKEEEYDAILSGEILKMDVLLAKALSDLDTDLNVKANEATKTPVAGP